MARRGFAVLFTLLGAAVFISIIGFALLYFAFGREPAVATNSTLVLRIGGDLAEVAPADVVSYVRGVKTPTVRSIQTGLPVSRRSYSSTRPGIISRNAATVGTKSSGRS